MREDRKAIIGGGVSVMRSVFKLLQIERMDLASGGLRHGLICDLIGDTGDSGDLHENSINRLARKFGVDRIHGQRVGRVASLLFKQLLNQGKKSADLKNERLARKLRWAAELHEIGSHISHSDYHKHGAYILDNADAMGFSLSEMHRLSLLVLGHRGKLRKVEIALEDSEVVCQLLCLRLAVTLCHARRDPDCTGISLKQPDFHSGIFRLSCRAEWAVAYPQSAHLLKEEVLAWEKTPWQLEVNGL
jgi:exopolyphosphatase/guanosine-5'-triphosphate,3'-diphosphate pyrophosphatase